MADNKGILILGDFTTDIFLYAEKWREKVLYIREAPRKNYPFHRIEVPGGAGALVDYLGGPDKKVWPPKKESDYRNHTGKRLKSFYIVGRTMEETGPVWRVDMRRGCLPWGDCSHETSCLESSDFSEDRCVIVMDFDGGWRKQEDLGGNKNWKMLADNIQDRPYLIRSHDPLSSDWRDFRKEMAKKNGSRPGIWVGVAEDLAEGALRRPGIWEDYRERIIEYLKEDSTLFSNEKPCGWQHVVAIRIDYDGVLVLAPGSDQDAVLFTVPGDQPGSFLRKHPGHVVGGGIAFVATFVDAICHKKYPHWDPGKTAITVSDEWRRLLYTCAKQGLARSRKAMETGYVPPTDEEFEKIRSKGRSILRCVGNADDASVLPYQSPQGDWESACRIICGTESEFRQRTLLGIGDLVTAEPDFARGLLDLERRLKRHADAGKKVLSFAIFGEPGSGKSFVAKSLQRAIDPDDEKFKCMFYDLSQFGGNRERLVEAFKEISQISLQGKTPFVLWDEFDCGLDRQKCGWLQEFLMPMEGAKFNEGKEVRELGRCVFVFMGGIHEDDQSFTKWTSDEQTREQAKLLKAPDFHSRLDRTLQIPPVKATPAAQKSICVADRAKLTRAMLIRHFLAEDHYNNIKKIEPKVVAYLLHVTLRHGVRSLSKIIEASTLDKTEVFGVLHLPSPDVLASHVDEARANVFLAGLGGASQLLDNPLTLMWRRYAPKAKDVDPYTNDLDEAERDCVRNLAGRTHEKFQKENPDPDFVEYDKLPPLEKDRYEESARSATRHMRSHWTDKPSDE